MQIDIFGSCISRDPFEFESNEHTVGKYFARSSLLSVVNDKKFDKQIEFDLGSNFRNRCLTDDLQKVFKEHVNITTSKVLVVDLIQERYGVNMYEGGFYTYSHEHRVAKLPKGEIIRYDNHLDLFRENIDKIKEILSSYDMVILHEANLCPIYYNEDGEVEKLAINETDEYFMKNSSKYYELFKEVIPNTFTLKIDGLIGTKEHKWGPGKAHYQSEYHEIFNQGLDYIIKNNDDFYYLNNFGLIEGIK